MYGPQRLAQDMVTLGFDKASVVRAGNGQEFVIVPEFVVQGGRFKDRVIDLGLQGTPDFPLTVASSIHVRAQPQLYEKSDTVAKVRNITDSALGPEWRYWSHNFGWTGERSARRLLSQVNGIFLNAS